MSRIQLFRCGVAATVVTAVAAATLAVLDGDAALALLASAFAAAVVLAVLADTRSHDATGRLGRDLRAALRLARASKGVPGELRAVRSTIAASRGSSDTELLWARAGLEGLRAELRALRTGLAEVHADLADVRAEIAGTDPGTELSAAAAKSLDERVRSLAAAAEAQRESHLRTVRWQLRRLHADLVTDTQALHQLFARYAPDGPLPPLAGWALGPTQLAALLDPVERGGARRVVECGSGTSTLWLAYALRAAGSGKVVALEHQAEYAAKTQALIDAHGLTAWAEIRHAPLVPTPTDRGDFLWYDVEPASFEGEIDLLLVDGPPGDTGEIARYPAFPILRQKLAPGALVIVDDAEREDEKQVVELWRGAAPSLATLDDIGGSMAILAYGGAGI